MITLLQSGSYKGKDYVVYQMTSGAFQAQVTNIGCAIMQLRVPDRSGVPADVVLGYDTVEEYIDQPKYFGAVIGRVGNRIKNSRFSIDGKSYAVTPTHPDGTSLHGGLYGFDTKAFAHAVGAYQGHEALHFYYTSADGEEGYPGNLTLQVTYWLTESGDLGLHYTATTDQATMCNITNHSFFNLLGEGGGSIEGHTLWLDAGHYTDCDAGLNTTGEIKSVRGTALDFSVPTPIGARIDEDLDILRYGKGYDLNYVLSVRQPGKIEKIAEVYEPQTGRVMQVLTNTPGVQLYSGNNIADVPGKGGKIYRKRDAVCLETQLFPGATGHMHFPSCILRPGQVYDYTTIYRFDAR